MKKELQAVSAQVSVRVTDTQWQAPHQDLAARSSSELRKIFVVATFQLCYVFLQSNLTGCTDPGRDGAGIRALLIQPG